jgi:hypothetical protein
MPGRGQRTDELGTTAITVAEIRLTASRRTRE